MSENDISVTNESKNSNDQDEECEDELDDLMMEQLQNQRRPVHRRGDGYERKHIYRGAVVKQNEKNNENMDSNNSE